MRVISSDKIKNTVRDLSLQANLFLRSDVLSVLKSALLKETKKRAKDSLKAIIKNAYLAGKEKLAICQDTGLAVVFLEVGQNLRIKGSLTKAINQGIEAGYRKGYFRNSVVRDPLLRGKPGYQPVIIHTEIVSGDKLKITLLPRGFGCENKSCLKMFKPTAGIEEIKKFIIDAIKSAGSDACPPYIVGVGIGGTADYACLLAKKALLRNLTKYEVRMTNDVSKLECELLQQINKLNIGPMGLGGKATCLAVNIEIYPTHIAGLPVAVNISCHALRSAAKII